MRDSSEGAVVAEVGASDATRTVSLRPGRYFVRGRGPDFLLEGSVDAGAGQTLDVGDERLSRVMFARLGAFGPIDLVVSGINPGANVGRAVYHSGTVGAALTARNGNGRTR